MIMGGGRAILIVIILQLLNKNSLNQAVLNFLKIPP